MKTQLRFFSVFIHNSNRVLPGYVSKAMNPVKFSRPVVERRDFSLSEKFA